MLKANLIYFSRTLTRDYRWIYTDNSLQQTDIEKILWDYDAFETDQSLYNREHWIVRPTQNGAVLYKFEATEREDIYSRRILAIKGLSFSGFDGEIAKRLLAYIGTYMLFRSMPDEVQNIQVGDTVVNAVLPVSLSLDQILEYCRSDTDACMFADKVGQLMQQYPNAALNLGRDFVSCVRADIGEDSAGMQQDTDVKTSLEDVWNGTTAEPSQYVQAPPNDTANIAKSARSSLFARLKDKLNGQ